MCHGIPDSTELVEGDIVNVDITAYVGGVHGDTNATFTVGEVDPESALLVERTREALARGIRPWRPAARSTSSVASSSATPPASGTGSCASTRATASGARSTRGLVVPHYDAAPDHATVIEPGMVFTIEPMLTLGTSEWRMWDDGWTVVTADASRTAQFEHTLLVTDDGAEILTLP